MRTSRAVDLVLLAVAVAWGSTYLATQELLPSASVAPTLLALRMSIAVVAMLAVLAWMRRLPRRPEVRAGLVSGTVLAGVFTLETYGVATTTVTNAGVLISLNLVLTPLVAGAVSRRAPSRRLLGLAVVSTLGVVLISTGGQAVQPHPGDWLILGAAALRAVHVTVLAEQQRRHVLDPRALTAVQMGVVAVVSLVAAVADPAEGYVAGLGTREVVLLVWLALGCTVFAFFAQTWALARTSPSRAALLMGTEPVWAAAIGVGLAGDRLGAVAAVGIVLVLVSTAAARRLPDDADGVVPQPRPLTPSPVVPEEVPCRAVPDRSASCSGRPVVSAAPPSRAS